MCFIGFVPNITLCIQDIKLISMPHFCSFTLVPYSKQDECFGIFVFCTGFLLFTLSCRLVLRSNYRIMLLIHAQFSPITAITLFIVTKGLMGKSLSGFLPLRQLSSEGLLYVCSDYIHRVINNFTMFKGIFNICFLFYFFIFFTHLSIAAL